MDRTASFPLLAAFLAAPLVAQDGAPTDPEPTDEVGRRVEHTLTDGSTEVWYEVEREGRELRQGTYRRALASGVLVSEGEFADGLRHGTWRTFHGSGRRASKGRYRGGRRIGAWTFWHDLEEEHKQSEGGFEKGLREGWWNFWTADGEHIGTDSGYYRGVRWDDAYGRRFEQELRRAERGGAERRHGAFRAWRVTGEPWMEGQHRSGKRHGEWRFWHANGLLDPEFVSGAYANGLKLNALAVLRTADLPTAADLSALDAPLRPAESAQGSAAYDEAARALAKFMAEPGPELANALLLRGRALVPALLEALAALDLGQEEARVEARRLHRELLVPTFQGSALLWLPGSTPGELARNRLTILRWHALWELTADDDLFFELELPTAALWEGEVSGLSLVMNPPVSRPPRPPRELAGPAQHYANRFLRNKSRRGETRAMRRAVDAGLRWLERHASDGAWDPDEIDARCVALDHEPCGGAGEPNIGVGLSALALLAFLADGNLPDRGPYGDVVLAATRRLLMGQDPATGRLAEPRQVEFLYQHAVATQALCELALFVDTPVLCRAAQRAVDYLLAARNWNGAWRYAVPPDGTSDTSVTTWAVLALVAARDAGLDVDERALAGALEWFDRVTDARTGRTGYTEPGSVSARVADRNEHFPRDISEPLTAGALLGRLLLGQDPSETPLLFQGAELVARRPPSWAPEELGTDVTAWFLGSHALFHLAGRRKALWRGWEPSLEETIAASASDDGARGGSWDPIGAWGFYGGRTYATALSVRTLLVHTARERVLD